MAKTRKTGMKSSHYTTVVLPPCKVCAGESTGYHFGVITCEACKAFFRRSLVQKRQPKCKKKAEAGQCHIEYTKSNNCSACRLQKCLRLGMSKDCVRRGRFSLPLRTQAIVEANNIERENKGYNSAMESDASTPSSTSSESSDDSLSLVPVADSRSYNSQSPSRDAAFGLVKTSEMECLIDTLISCQEAVYPSLKKHFSQPLNEMHDNVFKEFNLKQEIFEDVFGTSKSISTEEHQSVFAETGIDLDDRLAQFDMYGRAMEESIMQYMNFVKLVPGFKTVSPTDTALLMKAAHLEVWFFGSHMLFNKKLGVALCWDGSQNGTKEHMTRFFPEEWIDLNFEFADRLSRLKLSFEEIALVRAIVLTSADRCAVQEKGKVQSMQEKFMECLRHHLSKTSTAPGRRLYKIFNSLLEVRSLNRMNIKVNKQFLNQWEFIMHDFPLWKDMLSYDDS